MSRVFLIHARSTVSSKTLQMAIPWNTHRVMEEKSKQSRASFLGTTGQSQQNDQTRSETQLVRRGRTASVHGATEHSTTLRDTKHLPKLKTRLARATAGEQDVSARPLSYSKLQTLSGRWRSLSDWLRRGLIWSGARHRGFGPACPSPR